MKNTEATIFVVKANKGLAGWKDIKTFTDFVEADEWLCNIVKSRGLWMSDFTIVRMNALQANKDGKR